MPLAYSAEDRAVRENHNAQAIARLRPGVTATQATTEMEEISRQLEAAYPKDNAGWSATVIPLHELVVRRRSVVARDCSLPRSHSSC